MFFTIIILENENGDHVDTTITDNQHMTFVEKWNVVIHFKLFLTLYVSKV